MAPASETTSEGSTEHLILKGLTNGNLDVRLLIMILNWRSNFKPALCCNIQAKEE